MSERIYARIAGTGSYLPPRRVTNDELAAEMATRGLETSDEWIVERTGIKARHFAAPDVVASDLRHHRDHIGQFVLHPRTEVVSLTIPTLCSQSQIALGYVTHIVEIPPHVDVPELDYRLAALEMGNDLRNQECL